MSNNGYFFNHRTLKDLPKVDFPQLNKERPVGHSANKIFKNPNGEIIAVKCNCGKYHYVKNFVVYWNNTIGRNTLHNLLEVGEEKHVLIL